MNRRNVFLYNTKVMVLNGLQLNAQEFFEGKKLEKYLSDKQFDVLMLQEVGLGRYSLHYDSGFNFIEMLESIGYEVAYAPEFDLEDGSGSRGNAIAVKLPLVNYHIFFNSIDGLLPKQSCQDLGIDLDVSIYENRMHKWGLERALPFGFLVADIDTPSGMIRLVTMHYRASHACTESEDMKECTNFVIQKLKNLESMSTIIGGDFNIHKDSYSIQSIIKNGYQHINKIHHTSLNPATHPGFKNNIPPTGLMVDHVFMKGIEVLEYDIPMITVSDHLPIEYRCKI